MLTLAMFLPISKPRDFECRGDLLLQCVVGRFAFLDDPVGAEIFKKITPRSSFGVNSLTIFLNKKMVDIIEMATITKAK